MRTAFKWIIWAIIISTVATLLLGPLCVYSYADDKAKLSVDVATAAQQAAEQASPELPDDFGGRGDRTVQWSENNPSGLIETTVEVAEKWLVSETWCVYCPAAKARFLKEGNPASNIITIADAKRLHGKTVSSVPFEYTTSATKTYKQPPSYRKQWPPETSIDGHLTTLTKEKLLDHLRNGGPHQGKHWQEWHLESWSKEQLTALHEDDHDDKVPTYQEIQTVEATVTGPADSKSIAAALVAHVQRHSKGEEGVSQGILPTVPIDLPDSFLAIIDGMLDQDGANPVNGVRLKWGEGERSITFSPRVELTLRKIVELDIAVDKITVNGREVTISVVKPAFCPDLKVRLQ